MLSVVRFFLVVLILFPSGAGAFSYATGSCTDGCASGEQWLHTNANEVDTALDNLEAGTSLASAITRDTEWDTAAEVETVWGSVNVILATEIDTLAEVNTILGDGNFQTEDADLTDLADGSLTGSKVGTGLDITTATAGTLATARMDSGATLDSEWDTVAEFNAATTDDDFVPANGTIDLEITGSAAFSGTLQGLVATTVVSAATHSPTAASLGGGLFQCTNAGGCDVTLPTAVSGYNACWYDNNGGGVITIDAASGDLIILDGVPQPTAEAIDSAGARGDFICILALDATNWVTLGRSGTFIAGGAD